jgi:hypothetical protein
MSQVLHREADRFGLSALPEPDAGQLTKDQRLRGTGSDGDGEEFGGVIQAPGDGGTDRFVKPRAAGQRIVRSWRRRVRR